MIGAKVDTREATEFARKLPEAMRLEEARNLLLAAQFLTGQIRREIFRRAKGGRGGLARSFKPTFLGQLSDGRLAAGVFSALSYARIQEEGGIIRPKNRKFLAVPHPMAKIPAGKWPRHWGGRLRLIPRKGKPSLLVLDKMRGPGRGKSGPGILMSIEPKYVLLKRVRIKPLRYLQTSVDANREKVFDIIERGAKAAVEHAKAGG